MGVKEPRSGLLMGTAAYFLWGLVPLFWPLLAPASSAEALAHRFVWSMVLVVLLLVATRRLRHFRAIWTDARRVAFLFVASVVIALNWGGFIWGVNHGHVIEVSLGYFINPLVTVMLGVFVLGENLRRWQWAAVGVGAVAVAVLTIDHGRPPWIALLLAGSFATYGFLKKQARLGALESLGAETLMLTPVAAQPVNSEDHQCQPHQDEPGPPRLRHRLVEDQQAEHELEGRAEVLQDAERRQ